MYANDYVISLQSQKFQLKDLPFRVESIVDNRPQQYSIGMVNRGIGNKPVPAFLEKGVSWSLSDLCGRSVVYDAKQTPIVVLVENLQIY